MRATLLRSLVAALLIGPAIGFLNEATSVQKAVMYNPPLSEAEMQQMRNLPLNQVDATLRTRQVKLTRSEWLKDSIHYRYFWKSVAAKSIVPGFGVFLACVWIGWTEGRKTQTMYRVITVAGGLLLSLSAAAQVNKTTGSLATVNRSCPQLRWTSSVVLVSRVPSM